MIEGSAKTRRNGQDHGRGLLAHLEWAGLQQELGLSQRECQVVQRMLEGRKLLAISQDLNLGLGTVKTYCQRVRQKLGVSDQRELILAVLGAHFQVAESLVGRRPDRNSSQTSPPARALRA